MCVCVCVCVCVILHSKFVTTNGCFVFFKLDKPVYSLSPFSKSLAGALERKKDVLPSKLFSCSLLRFVIVIYAFK